MADQYYYVIEGRRSGPIPLEMLKELALKREIRRHHKVWCKGMKEWQPASVVDGLFDDLPPDLEMETPEQTPSPLPPELCPFEQSPILKPPTAAKTTQASKQRSPGLMALASLILPGLGQLFCGQDAKGLFLLAVSIAGNFLTGGLSSLVLCPLMSIDAYSIAKKCNMETVNDWEFFPTVPSVNQLASHIVPAAIVAVVLVLILITKLEEKIAQDAQLKQNQEEFFNILQKAKDGGY